MLKYKVRREKRSQVPVFDFKDKKYALLGELLLAEGRNFGTEIISFLRRCEGAGEFAGNVFRLEVADGRVRVVNDITDKECAVEVGELISIFKDYTNVKGVGK